MLNLACYNTYTISKEELGKLGSGQEQVRASVVSVDGDEVQIAPETPMEVRVADGSRYRVTPYNFLLSESQLVAPDYDLLLPADAVTSAQVREMSYWKTFGLVGIIAVGVVGGFTAIALVP